MAGASPWSDLYVSSSTLKGIRCSTGSQCSACRTGLMWSNLPVRDDESSGFTRILDTLKLLKQIVTQSQKLAVTVVHYRCHQPMDQCCIRCSDNIFPDHRLWMLWRWKWALLQMLLTCVSRLITESLVTPRLRTWALGITLSLHISSCFGGKDPLSTCDVVMINKSVLLEFIFTK